MFTKRENTDISNIDLEELKRLAKEHLENFHPDSMPPMKIEPEFLPSLIAEIERLQSENATIVRNFVEMLVNQTKLIDEQAARIAELKRENAELQHDIERALNTSTTLVNEVEELREDAERYQLIRTADWDELGIIKLYAGPDFDQLQGDELDAVVDAARATSQDAAQR